MKPIKFEHSNGSIGGEIPVNRQHGITLSVWKGTWRERITFLLTGKVILSVKGDTMPPTLLSADRFFKIVNPPAVYDAGG